MKLSIIVPVYNVEGYLKQCLDSIYAINIPEKEVIIVNDGSTDRSQIIIDDYKSKYPTITKVIIQENKGLSAARNAGILAAEGEFISFIDSDDFVDPKMYKLLFNEIKTNRLDIASGSFFYYDDGKAYMTKYRKKIWDRLTRIEVCRGIELWANSQLNENVPVEVWTNIFRREFIQNNKIQFEPGLLHEDTLFMFQCVYHAQRVKYFAIPFYYYRIRSGSITKNLSIKNYIHKFYIADKLQKFRDSHLIYSYNWDSMIIALYFNGLRRYGIKNYKLYSRIKKNTRLSVRSKIKKLLTPIYHLRARDVDIKL